MRARRVGRPFVRRTIVICRCQRPLTILNGNGWERSGAALKQHPSAGTGGIETHEQLAALCALGCDRGQGMLLSPPVRPEAIAALLRSRPNLLPQKSKPHPASEMLPRRAHRVAGARAARGLCLLPSMGSGTKPTRRRSSLSRR